MDNVILRFFREKHQYAPDAVAAHLGISASEYTEIETGVMLLNYKQARQLGKLFNAKGEYIYEAALQLDLLLSRNEIANMQKEKIRELQQQLHELQNLSAGKETNTDNVVS